MAIGGKIIGGIIGMILLDWSGLPAGALLGFLLGGVLGHIFVDRADTSGDTSASQNTTAHLQYGAFIYYLMCLSVRLAKADGPVNRLEIQFMENLMRNHLHLGEQSRRDAIRIWNNAKKSSISFSAYAQDFQRQFVHQRHRLWEMFYLLFALAAADSTRLHPAEEELLLRAAGLFHINRIHFDRLKARYFREPVHNFSPPSTLEPFYAELGVTPTDSVDTIKKKYRQLALLWHPDRVQARGGHPEAVRQAQEKFRKIKEAYEKILEARGYKR